MQKHTDHIDILFANAGVSGGFDGIFDQDAGDWAEILRVNLIGPFLGIKYAAPAMKARGGGSIVATASVAGLRSGAGGPAYSASKAGVINLVKVAATQLAGSNIRVNAICPGLIETGMTQVLYDRARAKGQEGQIGRLNPLKRGGDPAEIAKAVMAGGAVTSDPDVLRLAAREMLVHTLSCRENWGRSGPVARVAGDAQERFHTRFGAEGRSSSASGPPTR